MEHYTEHCGTLQGYGVAYNQFPLDKQNNLIYALSQSITKGQSDIVSQSPLDAKKPTEVGFPYARIDYLPAT